MRSDMTRASATIELWLVDLDQCAAALELIERNLPRLAAEDRERGQALSEPRERRRRLAAYTALRVLLERVAGPAVRGRPIVRAAGAKPRLSGGSAEFSLAHTGSHALIAVSRTSSLGVDLEKVRPVKMPARRRAEILAIGSGLGARPLADLGAEATFIQAWARLEAFAKARGRGIARTLTDLGLRGQGQGKGAGGAQPPLPLVRAAARRLAGDAGLSVRDVRLPRPWRGAVTLPQGTQPPRVRRFPAAQGEIEMLLADRAGGPLGTRAGAGAGAE